MVHRSSEKQHWETFWDEKQDVEDVYSNAGRVLEHLSRITTIGGKLVLEIGAGTGRDSFPLAQRGARVVQLDYAVNSLKLLKKVSETEDIPVEILGGDTFALPFRDGTFDIIFHQGLLEHFRPDVAEKLVAENVRVLKKGGLLLIDVPQRYHVYTVVKHLLIAMNKWFAGWERSFSVGELEQVMKSHGLTPTYTYGAWMYPSFFYRVLREVFKKLGIRLPLYPSFHSSLSRLRARLRQAMMRTPLPLHTGISIGVVGKK